MKRISLTLLIPIILLSGCVDRAKPSDTLNPFTSAASIVDLGKDWKAVQLPSPNSLEYKELTYTTIAWQVAEENGSLIIRKIADPVRVNEDEEYPKDVQEAAPPDPKYTLPLQAEVGDGLLVGTDMGEWGGKLVYYFDKNDTSESCKKDTIVDGERVMAVFQMNDIIYIIKSAGYGFQNEMYKLISLNYTFSLEKVMNLSDYPLFMYFSDNVGTYLCGLSSFSKFEGKQIETLVEFPAFGNVEPNSMTVVDNVIYIGTKCGILAYDIQKNSYSWYVPSTYGRKNGKKQYSEQEIQGVWESSDGKEIKIENGMVTEDGYTAKYQFNGSQLSYDVEFETEAPDGAVGFMRGYSVMIIGNELTLYDDLMQTARVYRCLK